MSLDVFDILKKKFAPTPAANYNGTNGEASKSNEATLAINTYKIAVTNWYKAQPYGFKVSMRNGTTMIMFLPINPSNLQITTNFATNLIPTLYGTVEEHSDVRYFDISIDGSTGMAPKISQAQIKIGELGAADAWSQPANIASKKGRTSFSISEGLSAGGLFSKTLGLFNSTVDKAVDLVNGDPKPVKGLFNENSGYVAFHNLYRVLLQYKKDAAGLTNGNRKKHPLTFFNYKDNNQYDVVIKNFTLRRSAENPMLYVYSIQLRGYNLTTCSDAGVDENLNQRLLDLGLSGVESSSALGNFKKIASGAKSIISSLIGGTNILGR